MRTTTARALLSLLIPVALASACGYGGDAAAPRIGLVTDTAGIDDRTFNASAWQGVQTARQTLGVEGAYLESGGEADFAPNVRAFIERGTALIIGVGYRLADATRAAALANPQQKFAIVDYAFEPVLPNVAGITFRVDQAAFLAGYLAAGISTTGKVGTFGGRALPPVAQFMVGYEQGVLHYGRSHDASVAVIGWKTDPSAEGCGTGLFTGNFENLEDGRTYANRLMDEGADVMMAVAGELGISAAAAASERGRMMIGVDADQARSAPEYASVFLTSVVKRIDAATYSVIESVVRNTFTGNAYVGTLANGGVDLASFGAQAERVSPVLKTELEGLRQAIIAGELRTGWEACTAAR